MFALGGDILLAPFAQVIQSSQTTSNETSTALQCLLELSSTFDPPSPMTLQLYKAAVINCKFIELSTESTLVCLSRVVELAQLVMQWEGDYAIYTKIIEVRRVRGAREGGGETTKRDRHLQTLTLPHLHYPTYVNPPFAPPLRSVADCLPPRDSRQGWG